MTLNGLISRVVLKVRSYGYRFTPWLMFTWRNRDIKKVTQQEDQFFAENEEKHLSQLKCLFNKLDESVSANSPSVVLEDLFGFSLKVQESSIPEAGCGVFVKSGCIPKFSIAALYPGTLYYPMDPIFFQSINNSFILKCIDGIMVDGNHEGLSARIFRSCALRDQIGIYSPCDTSWLLRTEPKNPLAVGQIVNNAVSADCANVTYQELDIPFLAFPAKLLKYIPNVKFKPIETVEGEGGIYIRTVLLISLREISEGEELFSSYFTEVQKDGTS